MAMKPNPVKAALKAGDLSLGAWLSLGSPLSARLLARAGFAWLTLDMEHSAWDWEPASQTFALIADAGCVPLARVPANRHDYIKRALDLGAMGVVVPMVNSVEEAKAAVAACKYPPRGNRSVGGNVHALNFGASPTSYYAKADDEILIVLQCEHMAAVERADEIFCVPGIDAIFVGPNDLAASLRGPDGSAPKADMIQKTQQRVLQACQRAGVAAGIHCFSSEEAKRRSEEGWRFLAINSDLRFLLEGAASALKPFRAAGMDLGDY
jgi:4-hydroxy-2-oxoheptanedioate aldolase